MSPSQPNTLDFNTILYCLELSILLLENSSWQFIETRIQCINLLFEELNAAILGNPGIQRKISLIYGNFLEPIGIALRTTTTQQKEVEIKNNQILFFISI